MAGSGTNARRKANRLEVGGNMFGSGTALIFECGIGRNRCDPQERKQPFYALLNILVDAVQNRVERLHEGLLTGWKPTLAMRMRAEKKRQCRVGLPNAAGFAGPTKGMRPGRPPAARRC